MHSFHHDSSFVPRTHEDTNIFSHDLKPIIEHNYSHASHDEDEALIFSPSQDEKSSHEFGKLKTWLVQENQNLDSVYAIETLNKFFNTLINHVNTMITKECMIVEHHSKDHIFDTL